MHTLKSELVSCPLSNPGVRNLQPSEVVCALAEYIFGDKTLLSYIKKIYFVNAITIQQHPKL